MRTAAPLFAALLALGSGCVLAPGMRMDEDAAVRRGQETTKDPQFNIERVRSTSAWLDFAARRSR